jgi:hypothetical protein
LVIYLQARNPNVPDIPNKLIKSPQRGSLFSQRNLFWNLVFEEKDCIKCIYTGENLSLENYAIDHFIPHSFVSHDLIWNLIPADPLYNIIKGNRLPLLDKHFESFYRLQKEAIEIVFSKNPKSKYLQEYLTIFPDIGHVNKLSQVFEKEKFRENIQPLLTIASNNGFQFMP